MPYSRKKTKASEVELSERAWTHLVCPRCKVLTSHRCLVFQVEVAGACGLRLTVPGRRCLECGTEWRLGRRSKNSEMLSWESRTCVGS